jgi:hypothetical protein
MKVTEVAANGPGDVPGPREGHGVSDHGGGVRPQLVRPQQVAISVSSRGFPSELMRPIVPAWTPKFSPTTRWGSKSPD